MELFKMTKNYSPEFKIQIVQEILTGKISAHGARKKYGIGGKMTIYKWLKKYENYIKTQNSVSLQAMSKQENDNKQNSSEGVSAEILRLQAELKKQKLETEAYKILLELGKEKYGLDLEKKNGAKQ